MKKISVLLSVFLFAVTACKTNKYADLGDGMYADVKTSQGDILLKLEYQKTPLTVANFVSLAEGTNPFVDPQYKDKKYYDGLTFHRVMKDFMIQGGDPTATGTGSPGYRFKDEIDDSLIHDRKGVLSMANGGPKTNGSQFFITHAETPWLNGIHTVFGEVIQGIEVVDSIAVVTVGEGNKPVTDVIMNEIAIVRNGAEAKNFDAVQIMSDYFAEEEALLAALNKMKADFAADMQAQSETAEEWPSGLKVITVKEATGEKPKIGQSVLVDYAGWMMDGYLVDTSLKELAEKFGNFETLNQMHRGNFSPTTMVVSPDSQLIAGFKEALLSMSVGEKLRVFIPSHLAYGPQGTGPIPPNANLVFEIEIVGMAN
ncbi:MAG: peptidylprolyl isomerase [Eudoraea sp.]|nr:peptidylprolyl isomerase [Eudoraea sp.]